ncbi:peptidylprolyl isomerase [bacterium]|nr:peptidylprolyl isomerase [bacterium]
MTTAKKDDLVKVRYTGTLDDGKVFDSNVDKEKPLLEFTLGAGQMIPGFDAAVLGMKVGETKKISLEPKDSYGERDEKYIFKVPVAQMPENVKPAVGQTLYMESPAGGPLPVLIVETDDEKVTVDANHLLAGKNLNFEITLVEVVAK